MSEALAKAVEALNARLGGGGFDGTAMFVIEGEGSVVIDTGGARVGDAPADVTLTADLETFREILDGSLAASTAFMSGRLALDGDMAAAMRLGSLFD
jgi:putative sterol carrier protein